ncbi:MAG: endonuclease-3 related protein [Planctomycetota bacterium]|jgi:endonuclease-3 related protein
MPPTSRCHIGPTGQPFVGAFDPVAAPPIERYSTHEPLNKLLLELASGFGRQFWWPAATPFEVMVGAILVQNTAWGNVELAMANLRRASALDPMILSELPHCEDHGLEALIRPSGSFRGKAKKLRALCAWLETRGLDRGTPLETTLEALAQQPVEPLRGELLDVFGVGPETADSILCYALGRRSFVVDTIARRVLSRHGICPPGAEPDFAATCSYDTLREWLMAVLVPDQAVFEEAHALFVAVAKDSCRVKSACETCPATPPV